MLLRRKWSAWPRIRSSLAPGPLHSALFSPLTRPPTHKHTHTPLLPFLPFIFSAPHPSLVCHGRGAANPSRVGARRAVRACVCVCVCVYVWMTEHVSLSCVCVSKSRCNTHWTPSCAREFHFMQACAHTRTPSLAPSPLINSVTGVCVCVFVRDTQQVDWLYFPRALLTDHWTMASRKEPHHAGIETYDEIWNYVVERRLRVGGPSRKHTHSFMHSNTPNWTVATFH